MLDPFPTRKKDFAMHHLIPKIQQHTHHNNLQNKATIKAAILLISSTFLVGVSAHALEPTAPKNTINTSSINTSAINLAIMTDAPTVLSETKRVTRAAPNSLQQAPNTTTAKTVAKADQAIYSSAVSTLLT